MPTFVQYAWTYINLVKWSEYCLASKSSKFWKLCRYLIIFEYSPLLVYIFVFSDLHNIIILIIILIFEYSPLLVYIFVFSDLHNIIILIIYFCRFGTHFMVPPRIEIYMYLKWCNALTGRLIWSLSDFLFYISCWRVKFWDWRVHK